MMTYPRILRVGLRIFRICAIASIVALSGCSANDRTVALVSQEVTQMSVGETASVPANVLARAMVRAGFDKNAIIKHGPAIRNALATAGGAQLRQDHTTAALFAVHSDRLYISSRLGGTVVERISRPTG
jgi:hypothetical protein